jgi:hypothetical protein
MTANASITSRISSLVTETLAWRGAGAPGSLTASRCSEKAIRRRLERCSSVSKTLVQWVSALGLEPTARHSEGKGHPVPTPVKCRPPWRLS